MAKQKPSPQPAKSKVLVKLKTIRALAAPQSLSRGKELFDVGAVSHLIRRGDEITGHVEGSELAPYDVTIRLHQGGIAVTRCSCPNDYDGICKHIVAVLLSLNADPGSPIERPALRDLLRQLDHTRLLGLLEKRLDADPGLAKWIEAELTTTPESIGSNSTQSAHKGSSGRRTVIDPEPLRELAESLIRGRYRRRSHWDHYHIAGSEEDLRRLIERAVPFLESGDGRNALRVLQVVTDTFVSGWLDESYASDEHMYLMFDDLGRLIAEAALMSDLTATEREDLKTEVEDWHDRLSDYGVDDAFPVAIQALKAGWETPGLADVLAGKARSWPPSKQNDGEKQDNEDERCLIAIRLRVLEASNRPDAYLNLARAARDHVSYAAMLVKLDRGAEAQSYAKKKFKTPLEAHDLARVLRETGDDRRALAIAEAGLALTSNTLPDKEPDGFAPGPFGLAGLADWLRDYAGALGKTKLALKAAVIAFETTLSYEDFLSVEPWAGKSWSKQRKALLAKLTTADYAPDRTLIFLEEGLIDDAVHSVGEPRDTYGDSDTLMRLAEAAATSHSDWVIDFATTRAAAIMDGGRAPSYERAAKWLEKAALAFDAAGREDDWLQLLEQLIDKHRRKYKLRPLLEALR